MRHIITTATAREDALSFILSLDPLVGDTACQLYSTYLLLLFLKLQSNQPLLSEEIELLNACKILTITAVDQPDPSGCIISRKVNPEILSSEISSKTQREKRVKEARKYVATSTFDFFSIFFQRLDFFDEMMCKYPSAKTNLFISASHCQTPLLPFYISCKIMFYILKEYHSLLIVNLKRLNEDKQPIAHFKLHYRYDESTRKFKNISIGDAQAGECAWLRGSRYCF